LTDAADLMQRHKTRHLAVTKSGEIVGVVSVRDLLHPVSMTTAGAPPEGDTLVNIRCL
jgi:signal-transduction protein with cAMP-binding, CBS, and nucleotidyltransferase domain